MGKKLTFCAASIFSIPLSAAGSDGSTILYAVSAAAVFFAMLSLSLAAALLFQRKCYRKTYTLKADDASALIQHAARQDSFFSMVLGNIPCRVFIKDPLDKFKYKIANRNFVEYYQLKEEDVIEHADEDIFEPDVASQLRSHDKEVCAFPGKVFRYDEDISYRRCGKEVFKSLKMCFETEDGHPYMLGVCVDVTEIVRNTACLQKTQDLMNLLINALPVNLFAKNADDEFRYTIANQTFADFIGRPQKEIIGKTDKELFDRNQECDVFQATDWKVMESNKIVKFTEHPYDSHGVQHHFHSIKMAAIAPDGQRLIMGVSLDITDLDNMIRTERINNEALSQAVAESNFRKVVEKSARTLRAELNCSRIIFLTYTPEDKLKLFHEEYSDSLKSVCEDGLENHEKLWNTHLSRLKAHVQIVYEDLQKIPEIREFIRQNPDYPTKSLAASPIFVEGKLFGGLLISYNVPHVFQNTDKELLSSVSKIIALAAIRDRQSRHMRQVEEENQALLDNISIPLWLYNAAGEIIQTNKAADRLFGNPRKSAEYSCQKLLECDWEHNVCPVRQVLNTQKTDHEHCRFRGRSYHVESNPIVDRGTGIVRGVVSSFYDVTELESAISCRESVNECLINLVREMDMEQAMETSIRGICEHLGATRCYIVQFNHETDTVSCSLEFSQEKLFIKNKMQNWPCSKETNWETYFLEHPLASFPTQETMLAEKGLKHYHNEFITYNVQSVYAHRILVNGTLWGYVSVLYERAPHSITSTERDFLGSVAFCIELMMIRKQYQSKIFESLRQAQLADKAKSMFLASMSHEIRTPLNAVIGLAELLKDGSLPKTTEQEYLAAISDAGNALLALINDVLDLSKLEAGQMVFSPSEVDFSSLIRSVCNIFIQKCQEKKLEFKIEIPDPLPAVKIDKLRVRQILFNLLGNAVKFTDSGSITVKARYQKQSEDSGSLFFSVADTGIGISEKDQSHIFQMFVQASAVRGTQAEHHGTGLGLVICKRMIEQMNGKLQLKSRIGEGSEFSIELDNVPWVAKNGEEEKSESAPEIASLGEISILVADDVAMNRKVLNALLNKLDSSIHVLNAGNADEAWSLLEAGNQVDLFLTDLWMPGMNGAELTAKIRRSGKYPDLLVAAVTADVDGGENFDMSVFDAVLTKPVNIEKLKYVIGKFKSRDWKRTEARA